jgi:putative Ca2+/H+ antiporter (TMEM165/GDT1 family)
VLGHACCTAGAVIAGRYISTKIDVKYGMEVSLTLACHRSDTLSVTLAGATLFILFGFIYTYGFFADIAATPSPEN